MREGENHGVPDFKDSKGHTPEGADKFKQAVEKNRRKQELQELIKKYDKKLEILYARTNKKESAPLADKDLSDNEFSELSDKLNAAEEEEILALTEGRRVIEEEITLLDE